jgi:hypothetical protein
MPTLRKAHDGHYFVLHHYQDTHTWQVNADGVSFLRRRGIDEDGQFSTDRFMHLWKNGWVWVGDQPGPPPGPVVIGDSDVPVLLREAIQDFHASVWQGNLRAAWRFGGKTRGIQDLVRAMSPDSKAAGELLHKLEEADFDQFSAKLCAPSGIRFTSWQLVDIRTVVPRLEYVVTIAVRSGASVSYDAK